ncbi:sodium-dependent transporter [Coxiella burnetii]|uniref:sodium-dependent transporter n=1 Tax=Coxiella burnetii TaxID=777 RepID=UPI0021E8F93D|nr:sodium-dependent transporter [Coxiella burnetii]UYK70709.1 sodium-dependent transporter [Coxiella burnetii]
MAGWVLDYFVRGLLGQFHNTTHSSMIANFKALQANPWQMIVTDTFIVGATMAVIVLGIKRGLERTVRFMFPALIILMLILVAYGMTTGYFHHALVFLFKPDFHRVTARIALLALGQAFFSLNIAMGIIIMFGAYLPDDIPIVSSVIAVCLADTAIALLAGLVIFPVVFANHLTPDSGPSLIFQTLPLAFSQIPFGNVFGALFFLLLLFAAFTSTISLLEPAVAWLIENHHFSRNKAVALLGFICWVLSFGTILSFSHAPHFNHLGFTFFQGIDFLTSDIMLPLSGLLIAVFSGWLLPTTLIQKTLGWNPHNFWFRCWRWSKRYFAPIAIGLILLMSLRIL